MIEITFTFKITSDSLEITSVDYPDEYRVAWGFFQEQGAEIHQQEIETVYNFLTGQISDWHQVAEVLRQSHAYDPSLIWGYLPQADNFFPSMEDLRQAIQSYAQDHFTSSMLIQESPGMSQ